MPHSVLFSTYLYDLMTLRNITEEELIKALSYRTKFSVQSWLRGYARPPIWMLSDIATVFDVDPVEVVVGWVIDQCPELEDVLTAEILDPRGSTFPRSTDLALRPTFDD